MKFKKAYIVFIILFIILLAFIVKYKKSHFGIEPVLNGNEILFKFSRDDVTVFDYQIKNLEDPKFEYKTVFDSGEVNKNLKEIRIENFQSKNIKPNHAYFLTLSRSGLSGEQGVALSSLGFCFNNKTMIRQLSDEGSMYFIDKCHKL